ncbi:MAG: peptide deformylase [Candidatus Zapsychrus exili]|nr:peptide deformylase [Candidatus Zapsychrus exili]
MTKTKLKVRLDGDPCLRVKSTAVDEIGPSERILVSLMIETMYNEGGVGLAASQIGINKRIFVIDIGDGPLVFINPEMIKATGSECLEEGCLSVPGVEINITRPKKILVKYLDLSSEVLQKSFDDLLARAFMHELDHLDGKLIVDYATKEEEIKFKEQLNAIHKKVKS